MKDTRKNAPQRIAEERIAMANAQTEEEVQLHCNRACKLQFDNYSTCLWKDCRYCKNQILKDANIKRIKDGINITVNGGNVTININR